jgi:anti-sigma factor RsiW
VICEKVRRKLSAYLDGELDAVLHQELAGHLQHCPECRVELEELGGVDTLLRGLPQYRPTADFAPVVLSRVQDRVAPGPSRHFLHRAWKAVLEYCERFIELLEPEARVGARSLDEFNDIPASFIGYAYFRILGSES